MLSLFGDLYQTLRLRIQYRRRVQERVLGLLEQESMRGDPEETGRWHPAGLSSAPNRSEPMRIEQRTRARQLVQTNPYARNILRLLENYVTGPGLQVTAVPKAPDTITPEELAQVNAV